MRTRLAEAPDRAPRDSARLKEDSPHGRQLTVGSLFAGIGGFDLGFERAGMRTVWFCEQDDFCQRVLAKHWPGVPCYEDIRDLRGVDVEPVDVLCGGFPCQDISAAGKGAGLAGARSGLWSEYARLVGEFRPRYVVVENVPLLRTRGLDQVLQDLDACGYDAEWDGISASAVGAPHKRDRIWVVAYPRREQLRDESGWGSGQGGAGAAQLGVDGEARPLADTARDAAAGVRKAPGAERKRAGARGVSGGAPALAGGSLMRPAEGAPAAGSAGAGSLDGYAGHWLVEPDVGFRTYGLSAKLDGGGLGAHAAKGGPGSPLRDVWLAAHPQALSGALGGSERVSTSAVLRPEVYGRGLCQRHGLEIGLAQARYPVPWGELRIVWGYDESALPSRRRELAERLAREYPDLVRELSCLPPPPCSACWADGSWEIGIPRVATKVPNRTDRLRALGNALVPQIAEWIGRRILDYEARA